MKVSELIEALKRMPQDAPVEIQDDDESRWSLNSVAETFYDSKKNKYVVLASLGDEHNV